MKSYQCFECSRHLLEDRVVWTLPSGIRSEAFGAPYCADCAPDPVDSDLLRYDKYDEGER